MLHTNEKVEVVRFSVLEYFDVQMIFVVINKTKLIKKIAELLNRRTFSPVCDAFLGNLESLWKEKEINMIQMLPEPTV